MYAAARPIRRTDPNGYASDDVLTAADQTVAESDALSRYAESQAASVGPVTPAPVTSRIHAGESRIHVFEATASEAVSREDVLSEFAYLEENSPSFAAMLHDLDEQLVVHNQRLVIQPGSGGSSETTARLTLPNGKVVPQAMPGWHSGSRIYLGSAASLGHELVHAWHNVTDTTSFGSATFVDVGGPNADLDAPNFLSLRTDFGNEELAATGLGAYSRLSFTESNFEMEAGRRAQPMKLYSERYLPMQALADPTMR